MIPELTREKILEALDAFDQELRDADDWRDWQFRKVYKYAISHGGRWYPVKHIISTATGISVSRFSGGGESNGRLVRLGFEIVPLLPKLIYDPDLYTHSQVLTKPCPVPAAPGVYAWFFQDIPPGVAVDGCVIHQDRTLLYIGISPSKPPASGKPASRNNLRIRLRQHYAGNAEGSTLRLTLGCLLAEPLGLELRRVRSGKTRTFHAGEDRLSEWMAANAFVAWWECGEPWRLEERLIGTLSLP